MDSPSNMTRAEKEQYVIELLKKNKGSRVIAERAHMSFSDIGRIRKKMEKEIELEKRRLEGKCGNNNSKSKSRRTLAIKMFCEGKDAKDIVIDLDLPPEKVRSIFREYLEMRNMYGVLQIYEEIKASDKYSFSSFVMLYGILSGLGMGEQQITEVLELAKHHQLEHLQWKVECLRNDVNMLEAEKTKSTKHILVLNKRIDELNAAKSFLIKQREELAKMNESLGFSSNIEYGGSSGIEFFRGNPELDYFGDKQMSNRY